MFAESKTKRFLILIFCLWQSSFVLSDKLAVPKRSIPEARFLTGVYISELHLQPQDTSLNEEQYAQLEDVVTLIKDNPRAHIQLYHQYPSVHEVRYRKQIKSVLDYLFSRSIEPHDVQALPATVLPKSEPRLEIWIAVQ